MLTSPSARGRLTPSQDVLVTMLPLRSPGSIVHRSPRRDPAKHVVHRDHLGEDAFVRLVRIDDDAQGQPLKALRERWLDATPVRGASWPLLVAKRLEPLGLVYLWPVSG